jgi:hypothetical protein
VKGFFYGHFGFLAFVPSISVMTIEATQMTTLQKINKSNSWAVFGAESFV